MNKPWDENPEDYDIEIICESCGTKLEAHFEKCHKCFSTARHQVNYIKKNG